MVQHLKDFLIKLQTLDIKVSERNKVKNGVVKKINFYDISHQSPFLNAPYKNELKEFKELAITDILGLPREQITLQLQRLIDLKELFAKFWYNVRHSCAPFGDEHLTEFIYSLHLIDSFIRSRVVLPGSGKGR